MEAQEMIGRLNNTVRMASSVGQLPDNERAEIAALVAGEQKPGSFGDLIKRSVGIINEADRMDKCDAFLSKD